jgi:nitroimidazol reductase NimA-like FMN-containing flavoprotein (pyridoxamine 5'-phosphate oxidase superfamily)
MQPAVRDQIIAILDGANDMAIATVRDDGYPQATTVSYVHDGLTIYFGCGVSSQKASN